jgi:NAD(P)-dependent dehydrogenase (short-subunit alcohol dehydrogenase family)
MKHTNTTNDRVVLITGASSGFGEACALHLSQSGYRVYGTSRNASLEHKTDTPHRQSPAFTMIPMDVRETASVNEGIEYISAREGRIDVVVNNAGIGVAGAVEDMSIDEVKNQFETNFFGVVRICQAVIPKMRAQHSGYIINISSIGGVMGIPFQSAYSASKFALEGFTEAFRIEIKPFGIHVVLIEPGDFKTSFTKNRIKSTKSQKNSVYSGQFHTALGLMEKEESNGLPPEKLAQLLEKIITHPSPKVRYTIGKLEQRLSTVYKRWVTSSMFERSFMKYYKLWKH